MHNHRRQQIPLLLRFNRPTISQMWVSGVMVFSIYDPLIQVCSLDSFASICQNISILTKISFTFFIESKHHHFANYNPLTCFTIQNESLKSWWNSTLLKLVYIILLVFDLRIVWESNWTKRKKIKKKKWKRSKSWKNQRKYLVMDVI